MRPAHAVLPLALLLTATPCIAADLVHVPWTCRVLGELNGIDVPATATIDDAKAGLAFAEQRADASLPGVKFCLNATRRAIAKAELKK